MPPPQDVVTGCGLQIAVAAASAGLMITRLVPESPLEPEPRDWAMIASRAAGAESLPSMLALIGCTEDTVHEIDLDWYSPRTR